MAGCEDAMSPAELLKQDRAPEVIDLTRTELLREAMRARDECDALRIELAKSNGKVLELAFKLHTHKQRIGLYFGLFCTASLASLVFGLWLLIKLAHG